MSTCWPGALASSAGPQNGKELKEGSTGWNAVQLLPYINAMTLTTRYITAIRKFPSVAEAARQLQCSERGIRYKIDGGRPIRYVDVLAVEACSAAFEQRAIK